MEERRMSSRIAKIEEETPATPESRLIEAEALLASLEAEHRTALDKIEALKNSTVLHSASPAEVERLAPGVYDRACEYFSLTPHRFAHEFEAATTAEPNIRERLVAQRGLVARLRQQVTGRQASALRGEYHAVAARMAKALAELNACIIAERDISDRVLRTGSLVSPLPDLGFNLVGTREDFNSPMAGWFRRAKKAGVI
jgi:hypothetical protein